MKFTSLAIALTIILPLRLSAAVNEPCPNIITNVFVSTLIKGTYDGWPKAVPDNNYKELRRACTNPEVCYPQKIQLGKSVVRGHNCEIEVFILPSRTPRILSIRLN